MYNKHFLFFESIIALAVTMVLAFVLYYTLGFSNLNLWISHNLERMSNLVAVVTATLLGFVIVGTSIIFGFMGNDRLRILRESKQGRTVYEIYFQTIGWTSLVLATSLVGYAIGNSPQELLDLPIYDIISFILLFASFTSIFRLWRSVWIIQKLTELTLAPRYEESKQQISK